MGAVYLAVPPLDAQQIRCKVPISIISHSPMYYIPPSDCGVRVRIMKFSQLCNLSCGLGVVASGGRMRNLAAAPKRKRKRASNLHFPQVEVVSWQIYRHLI